MNLLEQWVCRILRVPPEPDPPPGEAAARQTFRAAPNFFRLKVLGWLLGQLAALAGIIAGAMAIRMGVASEPARSILFWIELLALLGFLAQVPFTFTVLRLDYRLRWYTVTDRSLRIREGVLNVEEKTVTFANIQNLQVRQGPLQRLFGIADVEVKTAGGGASDATSKAGKSGTHKDLHTAYFRGVDHAEVIRDTILARLRSHRGSGLGDPDERHDHLDATDAVAALRTAARELADAAARVRPRDLLDSP